MFDRLSKKKKSTRSIVTLLEGSVTNKSPGGILAKLFRKILKNSNMLYSIETLIEKYEKNSDKDKSQIQTQVCSEDLTWKSFCDLIVNLLEMKSFKITIEMTHKTGKEFIHTVEAKANNSVDTDEEEKENGTVDKHTEVKKNVARVNTRQPQDLSDVITRKGNIEELKI